VTLTRGAKGTYRWEIEVRSDSWADVVDNVEIIDKRLREDYAVIEPTEEEK